MSYSVKKRLKILGLASIACSGCSSRGGSQDTVLDDPFAALVDQTGIAAWEYGECTSDAQCVPQGCLAAVCGPLIDSGAVCDGDSRLGRCLSAAPADLCTCDEGRCRWARTVQTMQCAVLGAERPGNLPVVGSEREQYPIRLRD